MSNEISRKPYILAKVDFELDLVDGSVGLYGSYVRKGIKYPSKNHHAHAEDSSATG
jgi:hypothetical protein